MRTVRIHSWGKPDVLRLEQRPPEAPGPGEMRLRNDAKRAALAHFVSDGFSRGLFKTTPARTFTLDDIADAHHRLEAGEQVGKIVATVRSIHLRAETFT